MKKLLVSLAGAALLLAACTPQELSNQALKDRLDQHDKDIAALQGDVNDLKTAVSQINSNIAALQTAVTKLEGNVYVKEVTQIKDVESNVIGYTIKFTDNTSIAIYHGEKGEQGQQGEIGPQGPQGATPTIGVKLYEGVYYWTLNDVFMTDEKGKMIPATGEKGNPGQDGNNGQTPQLRIEAGNWEVSYDGENWTVVGPAQTAAESVDVVFKGVKETKDQVIFTLSDDSKLSIDKYTDFSLVIDDSKAIDVVEGATTELPYTLVGVGSGTSRVDAVAGGDWWAEVAATDTESGVLKVTAGATAKAKVLVYAVDGKGRSDMRSLVFNGGSLTATVPVTPSPVEGGDVEIPVVTNVDYTVSVDEDALSWISVAVTKAEVRKETIVVTVEKNNTPEDRSGKIELKDARGAVIQTIVITQNPGVYTEPEFEDANLKSYLFTTKGYDKDKDGHLSAEEAKFVTEIDVAKNLYKGFTSLKGIEALYNLKTFKYASYNNKAETIDLSSNSKLEVVELSNAYGSETKLTTLNLSNLHALKSVQVGLKGSLSTITLGNVPQLKTLIAYNTSLASLDVTGAPALESLTVYGTKLTSLDVSANTKLQKLSAGTSTLTSVTLPDQSALVELSLDNAKLAELDLSKQTGLTSFSYDGVQIETIDLSECAKLVTLKLGYGTKSNTLKTVDIRKAVGLKDPYILSNVLKEVIVPEGTDVGAWSNVTKQVYDETYRAVTFTYKPVEGGEEIADYTAGIKEPFIKKVILGKFDLDNDGAINKEEATKVTELDLSECGLRDGDLTGLEVFPLEKLVLSGNKFTAVDVSAFGKLKVLAVDNNKLISIKFADALEKLNASHNAFTANPLPSSVNLKVVDLSYNKITSISGLQGSVEEFNISNNALTTLSLYGSYNLTKLDFSNNNVSSFGAHNHSKLVYANASHNQLSDWSFQAKLEKLDISYNKFTKINIASIVANHALKSIDLTGNDDFFLVLVGGGNSMPEDIEIVGVEQYDVLNASTNPSYYTSNQYKYITAFTAGENAEFGDIKLNFTLDTQGFKISDGGEATITAKAGCKVLKFYAVAASGTPQITLSRSSGKTILTKDTDSSSWGSSYKASGTNPLSPNLNESADKDWTKFVVDGDGDFVKYHFSGAWSSTGNTVADETIKFSVSGGSVVIFGLNLSTYRDDEAE